MEDTAAPEGQAQGARVVLSRLRRWGVGPWLVAMLGYAVLSLTIFGDALFASNDVVITHRQGDTSFYFTRFRLFGFAELLKGNMPLWNPHVFSGAPFLGGVQSAMLYPLNVVFLMLPLAKAINVSIAFHHFLTGMLMYAWARGRRLSPLAAFFSGVLLMFGAAYFMRAFAGHLTMLNALAWTPLILLAVDRVFDRPSLAWSLAGVFAVSMQALAGYPQSAYASALALAMYCVFRFVTCERKVATAGCLALIAVLPLFMCAMPLWIGLDAASESLRGGGVDYEFAATFSLPPENFLTLVAPRLFGDHVNFPYWGRWSIWDASLYFGIGGLALMFFGILHGDAAQKRFSTVIMLVFAVICLGGYTPAFKLLFDWVPGFNLFRAPSKYAFHLALYAALLSGIGFQAVLEKRPGIRALSVCLLSFSAAFTAAAVLMRLDAIVHNEDVRWGRLVARMAETGETYMWGRVTGSFPVDATLFSSATLLVPALLCLIVGLFLWFAKNSRQAAVWLAVVGMADVFTHAATYRENFRLSENERPPVEALYASEPGEYRILNLSGFDHSVRNQVMTFGGYSLWGYDPLIMRRISEFMEFTQRHDQSVYGGRPPPSSPWESHFHELDVKKFPPAGPWPNTYHPLMRMLRCRYVIPWSEFTPEIDASYITEMPDAFPRFYFAESYLVEQDKDATFETIAAPGFDLEHIVVLDREPGLVPAAKADEVELLVVDESTDHVTLTVTTPEATILVMTDAYSDRWRARALPGSVQSDYEVLPANHVLRAVPLEAGEHRFRIEFVPDSYRIGRWISIAGCALFLCLTVIAVLQPLAAWAGRSQKPKRG